MVVSRPAHSLTLQIGNGTAGARSELVATEMILRYEPASTLPSLNEGMYVDGPNGLNGKPVQYVTDGAWDEYDVENWQIAAFGDRRVKVRERTQHQHTHTHKAAQTHSSTCTTHRHHTPRCLPLRLRRHPAKD